MSDFFGYKHWTLETPPRCFNVGKGVRARATQKRSRNHKWHAVVKRYGLRVEICTRGMTNEEACEWEKKTIEEMRTFSTNHSHDDVNDIGCNFTRGGDGSTGWKAPEHTRAKMSESHRGNQTGRVNKGVPKSEAHKEAIRQALKNNPKVSAALRGNKHTLGREMPEHEKQQRAETLRLRNARRRLLTLLTSRSEE